MANRFFPLMTAAGMLVLFAAPCPAQPPSNFGPPGATQPSFMSRPTISPYLNLTRRGGSTASNYYNLVRPQNQFYQSIQQLQQEAGTTAQDLTALQQTATGLPPTGHAAGFLNHWSYFMTTGTSGRTGMARPAQPQMTTPGMGGRGGVGATGSRGGMGMSGMSGVGATGGQPNLGGRSRGF